jgi:hypothetical protein
LGGGGVLLLLLLLLTGMKHFDISLHKMEASLASSMFISVCSTQLRNRFN